MNLGMTSKDIRNSEYLEKFFDYGRKHQSTPLDTLPFSFRVVEMGSLYDRETRRDFGFPKFA
jgi:hypothetical protein